jgi:DNA-binding CsgD family transcriptional regulator
MNNDGAGAQPTLIGRHLEQEALSAQLASARSGRSSVMVVRGEAGIGKTALLGRLAAEATDFRVLHQCGSELEMELPYAGLQQLCAPILDHLDQIPTLQRNALRVAIGDQVGDPPDPLLVSVSVLMLLGAASSDQPTLCVIDDAQWIDLASAAALVFAARRLHAEPVAMLFGVRNSASRFNLKGFPELNLSGLTLTDSYHLLDSVLPGPLDELVKANLIAEAKGNPLALLELHRALTPAELAGGFGLTHATDPQMLERTFARRLHNLPRETVLLLLVAAADPAGRSSWLWAAAEDLGIPASAAANAEAEELVAVDGDTLRFRHPLIRSTIYRRAPVADRRSAHAALAKVISGPSADDYRAWHRAHAVGVADESVARDLERSATRARGRGGAAAAAAFLSKAAALTDQPHLRARRALAAAEAKLDAGLARAAAPLLATVESSTDDETLIAETELVRARAAFAASRGTDAPGLLLSAATRLAPLSSARSRETYVEALTAAIVVGRCATDASHEPEAIAKAAAKAPDAVLSARAIDLLLDGLVVRMTDGHRVAAPLLKTAIAAYVDEARAGTADPRWHDITHRVCLDVGDIDSYNFLAQHQVTQLRADGALTVLPLALQTLAGIEVSAGNFAKAELLLDESRLISSATGAPLPGCIWAYLAAYRGRERACQDIVMATVTRAQLRGEGFDIGGCLYSEAILHLGLSQYPEALTAAAAANEHDDMGVHAHVLNELVEAAVRCGETDTAVSAASELHDQATVSGTDTALGLAERAAALVSDSAEAERHYQAAITHFSRSPFAVYLPRTHLVYGEWLRRAKRRADARHHLRIAHDGFAHMRAEGFTHRARRELRTTGEAVLPRSRPAAPGLTAQELQIAGLTREGYTNAEIAGQLFISPRTVEWHLKNIYTKLGITSRRQLRHMAVDFA